MRRQELLQSIVHRPWPVPAGHWKYYQEWREVIFLHWRVDLQLLRHVVPAALELDLIDGVAWVSLVAFTMEEVHPRVLPAFAPVSTFHEINIRTYVSAGDKAGVYFLSIEAGKRLSAWIARQISGLPYRYSEIRRTSTNYHAVNRGFGDSLDINYRIGDQVQQKTPLDRWLTERYALFQEDETGINRFEIHHVEWPLHAIEVQDLKCQYPRFSGRLTGAPDLAHWSEGVEVLAWEKEQVIRKDES